MKVRPGIGQVLVRKHVCSGSDGYRETHLIKVPETCEKYLKFCGEVLAVGPEVIEVAPGDKVLLNTYGEYSWETGHPEDGELAFVPESDIFAVIDEFPEYLYVVPFGARQLDEVA